jgi:hypothetical protein
VNCAALRARRREGVDDAAFRIPQRKNTILQRDRAANFQSGFIYVGEDHAYPETWKSIGTAADAE